MSDKKLSRLRRARRARAKMRELGATRLSVHRTSQHIYAQIIAADGDKVLASASTLDANLRSGNTGNTDAAASVGKLIAELGLRCFKPADRLDNSLLNYWSQRFGIKL